MQIGSTTSGYSYAPIKSTVGVQTASASTVSTTTAANSQSQVATPKFVNGILTNGSSLLSTDTLSALFEMNDDGTPKINSEAPALQMKKGVMIDSTQDAVTSLLAMQKYLGAGDQTGSMAGAYSKITDDDKAMFRQVTGYNLFTVGGDAMIVDDNGNPPSEADKAAANELFTRMTYARSGGRQDINKEWFKSVSQDIKEWNAPAFSADYEARADAWFDDLEANRKKTQSAKSAADSSPETTAKPTLQTQTAIAAYQPPTDAAAQRSATA